MTQWMLEHKVWFAVMVIVSCLSLMFCPSVERARVTLAPLPGVKGTDYINASYIMVQKQDFTVTLYIIFDYI